MIQIFSRPNAKRIPFLTSPDVLRQIRNLGHGFIAELRA